MSLTIRLTDMLDNGRSVEITQAGDDGEVVVIVERCGSHSLQRLFLEREEAIRLRDLLNKYISATSTEQL